MKVAFRLHILGILLGPVLVTGLLPPTCESAGESLKRCISNSNGEYLDPRDVPATSTPLTLNMKYFLTVISKEPYFSTLFKTFSASRDELTEMYNQIQSWLEGKAQFPMPLGATWDAYDFIIGKRMHCAKNPVDLANLLVKVDDVNTGVQALVRRPVQPGNNGEERGIRSTENMSPYRRLEVEARNRRNEENNAARYNPEHTFRNRPSQRKHDDTLDRIDTSSNEVNLGTRPGMVSEPIELLDPSELQSLARSRVDISAFQYVNFAAAEDLRAKVTVLKQELQQLGDSLKNRGSNDISKKITATLSLWSELESGILKFLEKGYAFAVKDGVRNELFSDGSVKQFVTDKKRRQGFGSKLCGIFKSC